METVCKIVLYYLTQGSWQNYSEGSWHYNAKKWVCSSLPHYC